MQIADKYLSFFRVNSQVSSQLDLYGCIVHVHSQVWFPHFTTLSTIAAMSGCAPPVPAPAGGPGLQLPDWRGGRPAPRPPPAAGGHRAREPLAGERPDAGTRYYVQLPCVARCWVLPGQLLLHGRKRHFWQRSTGVRLSVGRVELVRGDQPGYEQVKETVDSTLDYPT